ncbi:unnamed protein product [Closterium sp. NIES-53]
MVDEPRAARCKPRGRCLGSCSCHVHSNPPLGCLQSVATCRGCSWTNLSGTLPASLGSLTKLDLLNLEGNSLSGVFPASLGNITTDLTLNLPDTVTCPQAGACVVDQRRAPAFCSFCSKFCSPCSPPGLCSSCKRPGGWVLGHGEGNWRGGYWGSKRGAEGKNGDRQ